MTNISTLETTRNNDPPRLVLEARDLTKIYPHPSNPKIKIPVLVGLNFVVTSDSMTYLIGPSGSGKTTLLNILLGRLSFDAGEILFNGKSLHLMSMKERKQFFRHVGYLNQHVHYMIDFNLTLEENLLLALTLRSSQRMSRREKKDRINEIMEWLQLTPEFLKKPLKTFSGGELQRAALAKLLIVPPPLLLLDEPTAQLDRKNALLIRDLLWSIHRKHLSSMIIFATHDLSLIQGDSILRLEKGRLLPEKSSNLGMRKED